MIVLSPILGGLLAVTALTTLESQSIRNTSPQNAVTHKNPGKIKR